MTDMGCKLKEEFTAQISELFLKYGLRSTSMDDIANLLKVSKKTLYQHFLNKEEVVEQVMIYRRTIRDNGMSSKKMEQENPLDVLFRIAQFFAAGAHQQFSANYYDIRKYYPRVYQKIFQDDDKFIQHFFKTLLLTGIEQGLFRKELNVDLQTYLLGQQLLSLQDPDNALPAGVSVAEVISIVISNFICVVSTPKGLEEFKQLPQKTA